MSENPHVLLGMRLYLYHVAYQCILCMLTVTIKRTLTTLRITVPVGYSERNSALGYSDGRNPARAARYNASDRSSADTAQRLTKLDTPLLS
eukprot:2046258-Pyramimonas_sp.AAC.2